MSAAKIIQFPRRVVAVLLVSGVLFAGTGVGAHGGPEMAESGSAFDEKSALAFSQAAIGRELGEYSFRNRQGESVSLSSFGGKPLLVSLIYTSCYHVCPLLTRHLARAVDVAREALGENSFTVLTIGFDSAVDSPERMRVFASGQGIQDPQWHFLSADADTIEHLVRDVGFIYFSSPKGFDHLAQTTVIDGAGRVYRQVYGNEPEVPHVVEPLKQLVFGSPVAATEPGDWIDRVRLFCTVYDPATGRYRFDKSLFVGIFVGILSLGAVAIFLVHGWRQGRA